MANTISIPKVVDPGIKKNFVDTYAKMEPKLEKIFKIDTQVSQADELQNYTGLTQFSQVNEGGTYTQDNPIQAYGVTLIAIKFGKEMPVTYEIQKWAKVKEIWNASAMLAKAAARHVEKTAASVFVNGYNTAYTSLTDAKPLFSTLHPRADGGAAQSNASASGLVFDETNLEVGILAMENSLDDRGELINLFAQRLIIPNALRKSALVVLKSEQVSGSADNDINVYNSMQEYGGAMDILIWNQLGAVAGGSDTAWFLEDKGVSQLIWQWGDKPQVKSDLSVGFHQDTVVYKGFYIASKGWRDWRGMWGSKGDDLSYAS